MFDHTGHMIENMIFVYFKICSLYGKRLLFCGKCWMSLFKEMIWKKYENTN